MKSSKVWLYVFLPGCLLVRLAHKAALHTNNMRRWKLHARQLVGAPCTSSAPHTNKGIRASGHQKFREPLLVCSRAHAALAYQQHAGMETSCPATCWYALHIKPRRIPTRASRSAHKFREPLLVCSKATAALAYQQHAEPGTSCRATCWYALHIKPPCIPTRASKISGAVVGMQQSHRSIGVPTTCGTGDFMPGNLLVRSAHKAALHTNKGVKNFGSRCWYAAGPPQHWRTNNMRNRGLHAGQLVGTLCT